MSDDLAALAATGRQATLGDTRCIVFGHLTRLAVRKLRRGWNRVLPTPKKIAALADAVGAFGGAEGIAKQAAVKEANATRLGPLFDAAASRQET